MASKRNGVRTVVFFSFLNLVPLYADVPTKVVQPTQTVVVPSGPEVNKEALTVTIPQLKVISVAFEQNKPLPSTYTCNGQDISPPLSFDDIPPETKSLALIVDDPDAPSGVFVHWLAWNLPANTKELPERVTLLNQGKNDFGDTRYRGPCPLRGKVHHYHFKVYALDTLLNIPYGSKKLALEKAMQGHILAQGELIGTYSRP